MSLTQILVVVLAVYSGWATLVWVILRIQVGDLWKTLDEFRRQHEEDKAWIERLEDEEDDRDELHAVLRELHEAYCERDAGHRDDFTHPAWIRWGVALQAAVKRGAP